MTPRRSHLASHLILIHRLLQRLRRHSEPTIWPSNLPGWMRSHHTLARIVFIGLAAILVLSCNFLSTIAPPSSQSSNSSDFPVPEAATMENLAEEELKTLDAMTAVIIEALGPEGESLMAKHLAGRQATLEQIFLDSQGSLSPTGKAGLAKLSTSGNQQSALLGTIFAVMFSLAMLPEHASGTRPIDKTKTEGSTTTHFKLTITPNGSKAAIDGEITITTTAEGASASEKAKVKAVVELCPDTNGIAPLELDVRWEGGASASSKTVGTQISFSGKATGQVDDNAELTGQDFDLLIGYSEQKPGSRQGQVVGEFAEVRALGKVGYGPNGKSTGNMEVTRKGGEATKTTIDNAKNKFMLAGFIAALIMGVAKDRWQHGYCVEILVEGVQDSNNVEVSSTSTFTGKVKHKFEGIELDVPIAASLSGNKSVDPTAKTKAPVNYTYMAGEKPEATATVNLETRSKRGVAKKAITFTTGILNWRPVTTGLPYQGQVCNIEKPFTITLPKTTLFPIAESYSFTPDDEKDRQGTVSMTHDIGQGCEVKGTGTYTIEITEGEQTEADIRIETTQKMYCPNLTIPREKTVFHILLEPYKDPTCK